MNWIHVLLHISVFLFFAALSDFFHTVNHSIGTVTRYALVVSVIIYMLLTISPLVFSNCPYNTPMTHPIRAACIIPLIIIRFPVWFPRWIRRKPFDLTGLLHYKDIYFDRECLYSIEAEKWAKKLEPYAMEWLFSDNDFSDSDMDKFLESLPGYVSSSHTKKGLLGEYLTAGYIKSRIKQHLITCATLVELSDQTRIARVSSCVDALMLIFQYSREHNGGSSEPDNLKLEEEIQLQQAYIEDLIKDFKVLCDINDHMIALRSSCISALAVQGFLSQLGPPSGGTTDSSYFSIPIYSYLFQNDSTVSVLHLRDSPTPSVMEMRMSLLHDGPLANLTRLAKAILRREHVPPSTLSFCWKTFDILLPQLMIVHSDKHTRAQRDFEDLHKDIRNYVHGDEMNYRMMPLLEILDTVARGRRLLMVFSCRAKYHSRANVVFGKEYLQNGDLLEAFARYLPHFIANHPHNVCMDLMEKIVLCDNLWSDLQLILWTRERSISSASDKFRVFEYCCNILNVAFSVLEDSHKVDWRAPEFGSLWQQFESFVTHGFQGAFMGRATSFRFGLIKARFCKVLLAQFRDDIIQKNILSFRSQWDVASLAKLIYYLGLQDKDDPEFWNSYFNGGHIGTKVTEKAHEMVDVVASDGPLSIFCQLGHLATSTIPSHHSDLDRKDIEKVLELQDRLMADQQMPLNQASDTFWKDLDRLREQVKGLCGATSDGTCDTGSTGGKRESLHPLLQRIDDVRNRRPKSPSRHDGHAEEQPSAVSDSYRIEVNGGSPSTSSVETGEGKFEGATYSLIPRVSII